MRSICLLALCLCVAGIRASSNPDQQLLGHAASGPRPNIIFVLTDDQDVHLSSLKYMPLVKKHLLDQGTYFGKHYCTTAVCCPSRVTLWTGKAAHNTNITDVNPPYGTIHLHDLAMDLNADFNLRWLSQVCYSRIQ
jgi:hypothetical protein